MFYFITTARNQLNKFRLVLTLRPRCDPTYTQFDIVALNLQKARTQIDQNFDQ